MIRIKNLSSESLFVPDLATGHRLRIHRGAEVEVSVPQYQMLHRLYPGAVERLNDDKSATVVVPDNVRLGPGEPVKPKRKRKKI